MSAWDFLTKTFDFLVCGDLPIGIESGLKQAAKILKNISDIAFINFDENDIVRHPVVSKIVVAYDKEAKLSDARR